MKTKLESEVVETEIVTMIKLLTLVGGGGCIWWITLHRLKIHKKTPSERETFYFQPNYQAFESDIVLLA